MDLQVAEGEFISFFPKSNFPFRYPKRSLDGSSGESDSKESSLPSVSEQPTHDNETSPLEFSTAAKWQAPRILRRITYLSDKELKRAQRKLVLPLSENNVFSGGFEIGDWDIDASRLISKFTHKDYNFETFKSESSRMQFRDSISEALNDSSLTGYSPLFYAVATGCPRTLGYCLSLGGNPNATGASKKSKEKAGQIPILAFTLLYDLPPGVSTEMVRSLLSHGAISTDIPEMIYMPVIRLEDWKVPDFAPFASHKPSWCAHSFWNILALKTNLTQRYLLDRAKRCKLPSARQKQVMKGFKLQPLNSVIYQLIGQEYALEKVAKEIRLQYARADSNGKPLVLVFAGPSGSGKTELAKSLGDLLSIPYRMIDCTKIGSKTDMFGAQAPYQGWMNGSSLNNHIVENDAKPNVVFLDEFEKVASADILNGFLKPFDEGIFHDARDRDHSKTICCKKTIWVLAVNSLDEYLKRFYYTNLAPEVEKSPVQVERELKTFEKANRKILERIFGKPLVGRITSIIPFFPFKPVESAVLAHKYILKIQSNAAAPVDIDNKRYVGNIDLQIPADSMVCTHIAETEYNIDEGARSIARGARAVEHELHDRYLEKDVEISDENNKRAKDAYVLDIVMEDGEVAGWELRQ